MKRLPLLIALLGFHASALLGHSPARGQTPEPDPKALVQQAGEFLQKQAKFAVDSAVSMKITSPMVNQENAVDYDITVDRPNRLALSVQAGDVAASAYSDGEKLVTFHHSLNKYVVESAPESLGDLSSTEGGRTFAGPGGFLLCVLSPDPGKCLLSDITAAKYIGREEVDEKPYHHCRFEQEQFDWDIWIAADGNPTINRIVPDFTKQLKALPAEMQRDFKMEMELVFTNWNFAPTVDEAQFTFAPPEGAEQVDSFFEQEEEQGPHPLLGKVAPPVNLENLEGKPVDLARHLGKEIVILDFWATWCGPCIAAMPEVNAAAEKFADRGVARYFVNLQEDAETIRAFLKEQKLEVPVALDVEGAVAAEYGVTGIPQTVIVGKDGKVQVVHVGFSDNLQKELTAELDALLAGKDLAAEELAKYEKKSKEESEAPEDNP